MRESLRCWEVSPFPARFHLAAHHQTNVIAVAGYLHGASILTLSKMKHIKDAQEISDCSAGSNSNAEDDQEISGNSTASTSDSTAEMGTDSDWGVLSESEESEWEFC